MRQIIESLKRLYQKNIVSKEKIVELFKNQKINKEEMLYILSA